MGHGFRFSLDERYIIDKSQFHCSSEPEALPPECHKKWYCNNWMRLFCVLWDICNINVEFCDIERKKQKKLDDFPQIIANIGHPNREAFEESIGISPIDQISLIRIMGEQGKGEVREKKKVRKLKGLNTQKGRGKVQKNRGYK